MGTDRYFLIVENVTDAMNNVSKPNTDAVSKRDCSLENTAHASLNGGCARATYGKANISRIK